MRVFISFSSRDRQAARQLKESLLIRRPGLSCFFDEDRLTGGVYWIPRLAHELATADAVLLLLGEAVGSWQELEYYEALYLSRQPARSGRPRIIPVVISDRPAPGLALLSTLHQVFALDPSSETALSAIERALDDAPMQEVWEPWKRFQPYKGLPALTETDAAFFFGREKETGEILDLLARAKGRIITLIGHSGVGKSSLASAGVLSRLKSQIPPIKGAVWSSALNDSRSYVQVRLLPGRDPVKELAASLVRLYRADPPEIEREAKEWAEELRTGSFLRDVLRETRDRIAEKQGGLPPKRIVLYVDQGEEIYTRAPSVERQAFSRLLADAAGDEAFSVLMSLRSDFYPEFQSDSVMFENAEKFDVLAMTRDVLVDAIRKPAEALGARFEQSDMPGLIADATQRESGALPLLSDLLQEMWLNMQSRGDGVLRWSDQPGIVDISRPLKRRADAFLSLPTTDQGIMRRLFALRLAQVAPIGEPVRRRARRDECSPAEWSLAEQLAGPEQRLLTISTPPLAGEPIVEVAHEQLLRRWPQLKAWLDDERDFLIWRTETEQAAKEHARIAPEQKPEGLLMGLRLTAAEKWYQLRADDLSSELRLFVETSIARHREIVEDKLSTERRLKEFETARAEAAIRKATTSRRTSLLAFGIASVAVLFAAFVSAPELMRTFLSPGLLGLVEPPLLDRRQISAVHWLDQNWTKEKRHWFHHVGVGTTFPIPYSWFVALEQPRIKWFGRPGLLKDSDYLARFGFIPSPTSAQRDEQTMRGLGYRTPEDSSRKGNEFTRIDTSDGLPVGFARITGVIDPATGRREQDQIGLTCAACHTGQIHYKGIDVLFDGGPAMIDLKKLELATGLSIAYTLYVSFRFDRFANRVLGPDASDRDRRVLKRKLGAIADSLIDWQIIYDKAITRSQSSEGELQSDTQEGFGRIDALNRIGNQVFAQDLWMSGIEGFDKNLRAHTAPVSFPEIWTAPWFVPGHSDVFRTHTTIEVLGFGALLDLSDSAVSRYRSSVAIDKLVQLEETIRGPAVNQGLIAPKWPSAIFPEDPAWRLDAKKVNRGRALYAEMCAACHLGPMNDRGGEQQFDDKTFRSSSPLATKDLDGGSFLNLPESGIDVGTDPERANVVVRRTVELPKSMELERDLQERSKCAGITQSNVDNASLSIALMVVARRVVERWFDDNHVQQVDRPTLENPSGNCPTQASSASYRARPLDGVWATAPYLHNGSVPSLYWLLKPESERPKQFCMGARDFDPQQVGFRVLPGEQPVCGEGETLFSTVNSNGTPIRGNSNRGHSFEGAPGQTRPGVVGRALTDQEQSELIEYLKTL